METARKVAKNAGIIIAGKIIGGLIRLVTAIFLVRYLGASNFGIYSFVFAYLGFFIIIADLGIDRVLIREISRDRAKADRFIGNAIIMKIILSVFALALACLIISFLHYPFSTKLFTYVASLSFLLSFKSLYALIFQVNLRMEYPILVSIFSSLLGLALFLYLIFLKASLLWFIIAMIINILPGTFLIRHLSRRFVRPRFKIDFGIWKYLLKESWPLALIAVFVMIYHRIDQLMLFQMKGAQAVGFYSAAVRLPEALIMFPSAFMISVFPLMSRYFKTSGKSLTRIYTLSFKYMLMLIIPIAMGTTLLSRPMISLIYGERFLPSAPALSILIWSEIFVFYGLIHYEILISTDKQRIYFLFSLTGAIVNVILNLILIPRYGIVGASIATLISYILSAGLVIGHLLPATRIYNVAGCQSMVKPLVASIVMGVYVYYLRSHLALAIIGGALLFILMMFFIRGIDRQDIQLAKVLFRKEKT